MVGGYYYDYALYKKPRVGRPAVPLMCPFISEACEALCMARALGAVPFPQLGFTFFGPGTIVPM